MITLLLDTSSTNLTVALAENANIIYEQQYSAWQKQSELLTFEIEKALSETNYKPTNLSAIVVSIGPGSYTGVRIAVSVAKVLGYALKIDVYKVSSLAAMRAKGKTSICVLDARSGRSYVGVYGGNNVFLGDTILPNEEVLLLQSKYKNAVYTGETHHLRIESVSFNRAVNLLEAKMPANKVVDIRSLKPVYLKEQYGAK